MRSVLILAAALSLAAASAQAAGEPETHACPPGLKTSTAAELYFGLTLPDGTQLSDADWHGFLDSEVTPRFPAGLSVGDVYGQWRGPTGYFVHENSKALFIVLEGRPDEQVRLDGVRDAYKTRFHQQSVMLVEQQACVSF